MTAKLHINISQGILDVEGDPDLVREIYADFKEQLFKGTFASAQPKHEVEEHSASEESTARTRPKGKRRASPKKRVNGEDTGHSISADSPKLDRDLDTAKLAAFYGQFEPKNHAEKMLLFLNFLAEELAIESPNSDQVYTCYIRANERPPKAFAQAFRDASGKSFGYIEYKSPVEIRITTAGNNHLKFDLKRKNSE